MGTWRGGKGRDARPYGLRLTPLPRDIVDYCTGLTCFASQRPIVCCLPLLPRPAPDSTMQGDFRVQTGRKGASPSSGRAICCPTVAILGEHKRRWPRGGWRANCGRESNPTVGHTHFEYDAMVVSVPAKRTFQSVKLGEETEKILGRMREGRRGSRAAERAGGAGRLG